MSSRPPTHEPGPDYDEHANLTSSDTGEKSGISAERVVTLFTAGIASIVAAQGMYVMFSESLQMPLPLQLLCFAFIELMVVASAMRARSSQMATGSAGVDGIAMWVLTVLSGVLAASHATGDTGLFVLRLAAPLVAAWGWERSMALERRQLTGREGGMNWRWSPQRLLVKWGIADPTDRTTAEVAVDRRLSDLARAADNVRIARATGAGGRSERRALQRLHRAIDKATDDGVLLGADDIRDRLAAHLEGRFSAYTLPDYRPAADWSTYRTGQPLTPTAPTLDAIDPDPIVAAQFAELENDLARELAARASDPERATARAIGDESRADDDDESRATETVDRAPIARENVDRAQPSRADDRADRAPTARENVARSRADIDDERATEDTESIAREDATARADSDVARTTEAVDRALIAREDAPIDRASIVAQTGPELGTDRESRADHSAGQAGVDARAASEERATIARAAEGVDRDRRAVVSLARDRNPVTSIARDGGDRARNSRAGRAQSGTIQGALARAIDNAPRARTGAGHGPFDRALSRAEANTIARAVVDRKLSRKTVDELTAIYEAVSTGTSPNAIGTLLGLPHSTVGRALDAATKVSGPRPI